ncbi:MAG: metal ABC transporter substrate-binding protein [Actinomycetaceae bacterium]|nr:metal ABC transporter substrate-binding protein [Actinomycetaceae bacterium]
MSKQKYSLKSTLIAGFAAASLALAGCTTSAEKPEHDHAHEPGHSHENTHTVEKAQAIANRDTNQALNVKTSIYPLQYLVERIVGEKLNVSSLTGPGVDAHSLELSPKTVAELGQADAVIYLSGFQNAVDDATAQSDNPRILDVAHALDLLEGHAHDHDHEHGKEAHGKEEHGKDEHAKESHGKDGHGHDHAHDHGHEHAVDPHFWLDPHQMIKAGNNIADFFAKIDPANAETYKDRAKELEKDLEELSEEMHTGLAKCQVKTFVVSHEAFGYLAKETGLEQVGVSGLDPEVTPSVARIEEVKQVIQAKGVQTIYLEVNVSPRVLEALAKDLGIEVAVLDPIATQNDPAMDYLQLMRKNLETLKKGQNCQ